MQMEVTNEAVAKAGELEDEEKGGELQDDEKEVNEKMSLFNASGIRLPEYWQCIRYIAPSNEKKDWKRTKAQVFLHNNYNNCSYNP